MKAVIDTNVFVSSFFGGNPRKIINLWKSGELTLCLSAPVLEEYIEVLQAIGLKNSGELEELLSLFSSGYNLLFTKRTPQLKVVLGDPDDDKFFECAVALKADFIISGDKKVLAVKEHKGIKTVSPAMFLESIA